MKRDTIAIACSKKTREILVSNMQIRQFRVDFTEKETCPYKLYYCEGMLFHVSNIEPLLFQQGLEGFFCNKTKAVFDKFKDIIVGGHNG